MVTTRRSQGSPSERQKWDKIFNGLVKMLKSQEQQLETLVKERKILQDRIKMQHDQLVSNIRFYEDRISQMKEDLVEKDRVHMLDAAKADLILAVKQRETAIHKLNLGDKDDELADFKSCFDYLSESIRDNSSRNSSKPDKRKSGNRDTDKDVGSRMLDGEVRRLKHDYEKLASEKSSEISALLAEKKFVWNQYNLMEQNLTNRLESKHSDLERANGKIVQLLGSMEQLQSSNDEKNELIARLNAKVAGLETDANKSVEQISKLSQDLEFLRKCRSTSSTPALKRCTRGGTSMIGDKNHGRDGSNIIMKKEVSAASDIGKKFKKKRS
ncbi:uncharacterized protein LOC120010623 isoform X2 [Tripterygium wilfordii]|uniref:uncharacterized protein LOC120010623 isoform X2 n=1 Tax=Tripterygium wilfordii TaxID=458696 RepID=UPI0018F81561|nr:uncharacterized protein LOC120010623 isoform X2 [Tripterygium wilfordii]